MTAKILLNSVLKSQFNYCPLIRILSSPLSNNSPDRLHQRGLRLKSDNYVRLHNKILKETDEIYFYQKSIMIEIQP